MAVFNLDYVRPNCSSFVDKELEQLCSTLVGLEFNFGGVHEIASFSSSS